MSQHSYRCKLYFIIDDTADDDEEVQITYEYTPGEEPTGPTFGCAGEPGEGARIDIEKVEIFEPKRNRWIELPDAFARAVMKSAAMEETLIEHVEGGL